MQRRGRDLRARGLRAEGEERVRSGAAVAQTRPCGQALERLAEHHLGRDDLAHPAHEGRAASRRALRRRRATVGGRELFERGRAVERGRGVERVRAVARGEQRAVRAAEVRRERRFGDGAPAGLAHREAGDGRDAGARRGVRLRAGLVRVARELVVEGGEFGSTDERDEPEHVQLGVVAQRTRPAGPRLEFRGAAFGVAREVGARRGGEPFLVSDRELDRGPDAGRAAGEGVTRAARVGAGDRARSHDARGHAAHDDHEREHPARGGHSQTPPGGLGGSLSGGHVDRPAAVAVAVGARARAHDRSCGLRLLGPLRGGRGILVV